MRREEGTRKERKLVEGTRLVKKQGREKGG